MPRNSAGGIVAPTASKVTMRHHARSLLCRPALLTTLAVSAACGGVDVTETGGQGGSDTSSNTGGAVSTEGSGESGGPDGVDVCAAPLVTPPLPAVDACARVSAGPPGEKAVAVDLSAAHAGVRFFGPVLKYSTADQALVAALEPDGALTSPDLAAYAAALPGVACAVPAAPPATLGPASVEQRGDTAIVRPGTGAVALPSGVTAVMIDLRDLPPTPDLRAALEAAVGPALATPVPRASRSVRRHEGLKDEVWIANNVYENTVKKLPQSPIPATGAADLPLAVLTGPVMAPEAAEFAISLRIANRAFVFGEDMLAAVAEMRWQGVGTAGVAYRWGDLSDTKIWPDAIAADRRVDRPECLAIDLPAMGAPPPFAGGLTERPRTYVVDSFGDQQPAVETRAVARAALVVAHGAARRFYPYFPTVGDTIDERLGETLAAVGAAPDRASIRNSLRRFGAALVDGHNFVFDGSSQVGYFAVSIENVNGKPVVRRSATPGVDPGDTITKIDGVPADAWYATELARSGGASDGYRFHLASREFIALDAPTDFELIDTNGQVKTVTVQPQAASKYWKLQASSRPAGDLGDLGAPQLYYINLDSSVMSTDDEFNKAILAAAGAAGLVVDMRGYPKVNHYLAARTLIQMPFSSPVFRVPLLDGPDVLSVDESSYSLVPKTPAFTGPIALIVGNATVSAAENFSIMLVDANRVKVIGRRSAATNGNITGVELPGSFKFTFTGMEVLHANMLKTTFHGIGIVPDTETVLTAADFRDGVDPELMDAIAALTGP